MKTTPSINQKWTHYLRPIIGGIAATFGSFIFVSIEISTIATIITFKANGTFDYTLLEPYIDRFITYTGPPSAIIITSIVALLLAHKWNNNTHIDQWLLTLSSFASGLWLSNHFEQITLNDWILVNIIIIYGAVIFGNKLEPHYRKWKLAKKKNKTNQLLAPYNLTEREKEIVIELLNGNSNKEIGAHLFIEEGTVKQHLKGIFKKMDCKSRAELISALAKKK